VKPIASITAVLLVVVSGAAAQDGYKPPAYLSGDVPVVTPLAAGGGEVLLEATVASNGRVTAVTPLRTTPPFSNALADAVARWRFRPAEERIRVTPGAPLTPVAVAATVLVGGVFRPPAIQGPTLGTLPKDVARGSAEAPYPFSLITPPFPPLARADGVVLVEVRVEPSGRVSDARICQSARPFDEPALAAARQIAFRSARHNGAPVAALAYIAYGFRQPVLTSSPPK
jgi:TonB family protein